jgi:hypothetical protein
MMGMYKSKELWRGPESINILKHSQYVAHDSHAISKSSLFCHTENRFGPYYAMHHTFCNSTLKHLIPLIF